ncbi:MAG TPA: META domain-containing protein [Terriglobia bacterium]|nr:META domain-containing protein [Terriglobia bacterium]
MLRYWKLKIGFGLLCLQAISVPVGLHNVAMAQPVQTTGKFEVTGQITYREKMAVPAQSVAVVTLRDITVANAASTVIAEQRIDLAGRQVPIAFRLTVDRAKLQSQRKYAVRGSIVGPDEKFLWVTMDIHVVDSSKPSVAVGTLMMSRASGESADPQERLRSGEWTIVKLNGVDVPKGARATLTFGASAVLSGRSFCNSFSGTYALAGQSLSLSPKASTLMACAPDVANLEKLLMEMLADVQRFEMSEFGTLTLRTSNLRTITASLP